MTIAWYLTTDASDTEHVSPPQVVARARALYPGLTPSLRLNQLSNGELQFHEAFMGSGSLSAMYSALKGKRRWLECDLRWTALALIECGSPRVGLLRMHESTPLPERWPAELPRRTLDNVLKQARGGTLDWWELELGAIRFAFRDVEARLFAPLAVEGDNVAGGFLSSFEVTAHSVNEAIAELRRAVAAEEGARVVTMPRPSILGVDDSSSTQCVRVSGRVFFP